MQELIRGLTISNQKKIVMLVMDGLGGLPRADGSTELEAAETPNLDDLAGRSACGAHLPVAMAITPGSGPGHLGLFGYDPKEYRIGRGILEALGLGLEVLETDVALRCNYSTIKDGKILDRRAGRIPTDESRKLTASLQEVIAEINGVKLIFAPGVEHRFAVILRFPEPLAEGASALNDTDPQKEGLAPLPLEPRTPHAKAVAEIAAKLAERAQEVLKDQKRANFILMRGFSEKPRMPSFQDAYGLNPLAIAAYPMYRGVAKLVGMEAPEITGGISEEVACLEDNYDAYDFFFMHIKKIDSHGEDGNFEAKAQKIAEVDRALPKILSLKPDVLVITGDHCTPSTLRSHSWHPVPVLLHSRHVLGSMTNAFNERQCLRGELGVFPTVNLMPLALANAERLKKFGA